MHSGIARTLEIGADGQRRLWFLKILKKKRRLWLDANGEAEIERTQCLPGYLMAEDLARAALFLGADDSRMCTGQSFLVDGGWV